MFPCALGNASNFDRGSHAVNCLQLTLFVTASVRGTTLKSISSHRIAALVFSFCIFPIQFHLPSFIFSQAQKSESLIWGNVPWKSPDFLVAGV